MRHSRAKANLFRPIVASGLAATLIFSTLTGCSRPQSAEEVRPKSAIQEQKIKLQLMSQDVIATDRLTRMDAKHHLKTILKIMASKSPAEIHSYMEKLQKSHQQIKMLTLVDFQKQKTILFGEQGKNGSAAENKQLNTYFSLAKQALRKHQNYESPSFLMNGDKYFIMAQCAEGNRPRGVIALMSQHILSEVVNHQRKNLRLIPYPKEGKYRVESVHADTLKDMTVRTGHDNEKASHYYENEVVVRFRKEPTAQEMRRIRADLRCEEARKLGYTYIFRADGMNTRDLTQYFLSKWNPVYAEPHYLYLTNENDNGNGQIDEAEVPNDILFSPYQWNLPAIETNRGWNLSKGSDDVVVAVVDTGVDMNHPDLRGQFVKGYNVIEPDKQPMDDVGHGTHVSGIISAVVNNGEGVAGMTWYNKIMPIKALDKSGSGTTYSVAQGIIWATDHGAKVINMSLGNYADAKFLHDAVKYAYDRDVVLVAATGNDSTERPGYPAAYPEVFAVSATDSNMKLASYSNYGDYIDVTAPGTSIASTYPNNQYAALSGTSMASPHVAALAALIRTRNPNLTNKEVMHLMRKSVIDLGTPGRDKYYGYGQVDVYKALKSAGGGTQTLQFWPWFIERRLREILDNGK
ncbi:S8 family peptidase [Paenibacillus sediminis]|uniref:Type VII secretion-associated serine protease mycosin n=1 Tax=Paenibacillus sediminis TaxID=664909 RepID=A0ABS4GYS1_9BACL|nr:S8 family peptidase [Paenibacillus sediminis]MBP1935416.1 type VII secretion-associated serine protease mycosin [Paenibacillus sediminis]